MDEQRIAENLMLISLRISQWTGRKKDKKVSRETVGNYNASMDAGSFHKVLLPELKEVQKIVNQARAHYYHYTSPWGDNGDRVSSVHLYDKLVIGLRRYREDFNETVKKVKDEYQVKVWEQQKRLGEMFDPNDYPKQEVFARKFDFRWFVSPLPLAGDIRLKVSEAERERIREESRVMVQESLQESVRDTWERLHKVVAHCYAKLNEKDAIFRDTLIGNVKDLVDVLPGLNLFDDPELARIGKAVEEDLCKYHPQTLREKKKVRGEAALVAKGILARIETMKPQVGGIDATISSKMGDIVRQATKFDTCF